VSCRRTSKTLILKILSSSTRGLKASILDAYCTYFLYLSIRLHASILSELLKYLCFIHFHELSLLTGLGRTLKYFYVMLSFAESGVNHGNGLTFL
jgi:Na+/H+ antiporter NhaA